MDAVGDQTSDRDELPPHFSWLRFRGEVVANQHHLVLQKGKQLTAPIYP